MLTLIEKVLLMNKKKSPQANPEQPPVVSKTNIFTNNFKQYDSTTNKEGINYSDNAIGDETKKTITHTCDGFSSTSAYIFSGYTIGSKYIYSVKVSGETKGYFIKVKCLKKTGATISDTSEIIDQTEVTFTVPEDTAKIQIFVGTSGEHKGTTVFSDLKVEEV